MPETMLDTQNYRPGVGVMLLNAHGQVLICRRSDVAEGGWQMPQGGIDMGEEPKRAALRELKEEIGTDSANLIAQSANWYRYDLPEALLGKTWGGKYVGQRLKWFLMRFTGRDEDIRLENPYPEFTNWLWVAPDHLPDLVVSFKRDMYRDVLSEFRGMCGAIV